MHWGERKAELTRLALGDGVDVRAVLLFAADSTPSEVQHAWEMPIVRRFAQLATRARAQQCHIVGYSSVPHDVLESRVKALGSDNTLSCTSAEAAREAMARLLDGAPLPPAWADALVDSPYASRVVLPGAEPFNRTGATLYVQIDGFCSLHALYARYGVLATPAKLWAFVNKYLLGPMQSRVSTGGANIKKKATRGLSFGFGKSKK
jgi:hypothetical protein